MAAHVNHDLLKEQRNLQQIKSLFRTPFVTSGLQDSTAVFIVGMPRSGSTLVEQMLASHTQVCWHLISKSLVLLLSLVLQHGSGHACTPPESQQGS